MRLIFVALASLVIAVVTFYGAMILTLVFIGMVWPQSGDRNLGLGMMLLTVGVPIWLLAATAGGILTFRRLWNKATVASQNPN